VSRTHSRRYHAKEFREGTPFGYTFEANFVGDAAFNGEDEFRSEAVLTASKAPGEDAIGAAGNRLS
jgi:hypothetical protein